MMASIVCTKLNFSITYISAVSMLNVFVSLLHYVYSCMFTVANCINDVFMTTMYKFHLFNG